MAGVSVTIDTRELEAVLNRLQSWANRASLSGLYASIGAEVESQTRRRIEDERTAPDGTPWADWSPRYAATRHGNHSLLQNEGHLVDSITHLVTGNSVEVGTNLVYGATHQVGRGGIPARPFLGLSAENTADVLNVMDDWVTQQLKGI